MLISRSLTYVLLTRYLVLPLIYFTTSPTLATYKIAFIWGFSKQVLIFIHVVTPVFICILKCSWHFTYGSLACSQGGFSILNIYRFCWAIISLFSPSYTFFSRWQMFCLLTSLPEIVWNKIFFLLFFKIP